MTFSWWQLGEGAGSRGDELALYEITCPFCMEQNNFELEFRAAKKKPNSRKVLNFDTYKCGNCSGYVMVLWSASERGGLHGYKVLPWPIKLDRHPAHWPEDVGRFWLQANRSLKEENWDAAAVMARSSLQLALRAHGAGGANLKLEIDDLAKKGILPPHMEEWSHEVRELGNDSAHPQPGQAPTSPKDAKDIAEFLGFLLEYLYDLPQRIATYRARK